MPAIRPHQKTRLHLRDSTTVDFGPEGQTLTNDSVTVTDDVFTFTPPSRIDAATTFPTSAFSFSLWYKVDQTGSGTQRIIGDRDGTTGLDFYFGAGASGTVNLEIYDGSGFLSIVNAMVRDGEWHHLVAGRTDAGDLFGYVDGVALTTSGTLSHTATTGSIITVGSYPGNSNSSPYKGDMADIRVVDYALTAGEVFDLYNEGRNWVLQRRVDQAISIDPSTYAGSGDLLDRSGNGNDATLVGNATVTGGVIVFPDDGASRVELPTTGMDKTKGTIALWWRPDSVSANWRYFADNPSGARMQIVQSQTGGNTNKFTVAVDGRSQVTTSAYTLAADTWHHLAATWDTVADEFLVYIDGEAVSMAAASGTLGANALGPTMYLGANNTRNHVLDGDIDKFLVANEVYTAEQIAQIYALGREEDTGTAAFDLPERKQLPDTVVHVLDGSTDAGFYGEELTLEEATYANGVYTLSGTTPRIDMGQTRVFNEADGFAFAGWFKPTAVSGRQFLWCHTTITYVEMNGSSSIRYKASDNVLRSWSYTFAAGETYHIAVSNDGAGNAELWVNGTSVGTIVVNGSSTFSFSQISLNNASFEFQGDTWDNRVFDRPITAGEVANLYRKGIPALRDAEVLRIDPARYSGSGDLIDQTGGGSDATLLGTTSVTNGTIVFNGDSTDRVEATVSGLTKAEGTYAFWFKPNFDSTDTSAYYFCDVATTRIAFFKTSGTNEGIQIYVDGKDNTDNGISYSAGEWHHLAATWDEAANEYRIYFDGESTGTAVPNGSLIGNADTGALSLGRAAAGVLPFDGEFDKFLACDKALTADQIAFLASSREFADPFPEPFLGLGGETLNIQPSRYSGNGDLLDESGNGNDLTLPSGYSVADGVISSDGTADGPDTGIDLRNAAASIGFWIKTTDTVWIGIYASNSSYALSSQDGQSSSTSSGVSNQTLYVDGVVITDTRQALYDATGDGSWHHVALTGDFGSNFNPVQLFQYNSLSPSRLTGEIDDLRIESTRKWSAEEVKLLASSRGVELPNTRDAKLYVSPSYDDASNGSTSVIDYSGSTAASGQPTFGGTPTWTADTSPDNGRSSLVFDSSDSVSASTVALPGTISEMSALAWVKVADVFSRRTVLAQYGASGNYSWRLAINTTGVIWFQTSVDGTATVTHATSGVYDESGDWFPIVVTWDQAADECKFYVSGTLVDTRTGLVAGLFDAGQNTQIGIAGAANPMSGSIDDVALFNRVLTPAEIAFFSDKRNPYGTPYTAPVTGTAAVRYYRTAVHALITRGAF